MCPIGGSGAYSPERVPVRVSVVAGDLPTVARICASRHQEVHTAWYPLAQILAVVGLTASRQAFFQETCLGLNALHGFCLHQLEPVRLKSHLCSAAGGVAMHVALVDQSQVQHCLLAVSQQFNVECWWSIMHVQS